MAIRKDVGIKIVVASVCLLVVLAAAVLLTPTYFKPVVDVSVGNGVFKARIAKSQTERDALMNEVSGVIGSNALMFAYPDDNKWSVDVSGVKDPVDVVWMDANKRITTIYKNAYAAAPSLKSGKLTPSAMVKYVLILPASSINLMAIGTGKAAIFEINVDEIK